ncbi:nucleotide sugar dehydrogenase [Micromonospora sp. NPDC047134]|uniref:nucleotide sugar dehydrogenase n=1 Tax=Micromonospora sp. NPDC047134 TaxID=3154340 RepID=UPI0033C47F36
MTTTRVGAPTATPQSTPQRPPVAVIGIGYAGLPLALEAAAAGHPTVGLDIRAEVVDQVNSGSSHVETVSDERLRSVAGRFRATLDPQEIVDCSVVVICVPTPLNEHGVPDLSMVVAAARTLSAWLRPGQLVVLESTVQPGCTENMVRPILETTGLTAGVDFNLAFASERVDPGNPSFGVHNTPKVIGGLSGVCLERAAGFYEPLTGSVHRCAGIREAEASKMLENTYRMVNVALINEFARYCLHSGIDVWDVIEAARTKPFGFTAFQPSAGVGGHCIPVDPQYLAYTARAEGQPLRLVEQARAINEETPLWAVERIVARLRQHGRAVQGARVLLLGITYKPGVADVRHSPAMPIVAELWRQGVQVLFHDPQVDTFEVDGRAVPRIDDPVAVATEADATVVLQRHREYDPGMLARVPRLISMTGRDPYWSRASGGGRVASMAG